METLTFTCHSETLALDEIIATKKIIGIVIACRMQKSKRPTRALIVDRNGILLKTDRPWGLAYFSNERSFQRHSTLYNDQTLRLRAMNVLAVRYEGLFPLQNIQRVMW